MSPSCHHMCMINVVTCNEVNISPPFKNYTTHLSLRTSYPSPPTPRSSLRLSAHAPAPPKKQPHTGRFLALFLHLAVHRHRQ